MAITTHNCTSEQFVADIDTYLDLVKSGSRVEIDKKAVLIHPKDLRFLDKCAEFWLVEAVCRSSC